MVVHWGKKKLQIVKLHTESAFTVYGINHELLENEPKAAKHEEADKA